MNIFILDNDLKKAAQYHNNVHLNKMLLEATQMLSTAHHLAEQPIEGNPYKGATHQHHPCNKWLRASKENYIYLVQFAQELIKECEYRGYKTDKYRSHMSWFAKHIPTDLPSIGRTDFAQAIANSNYKHEDAVTAYRTYHIFDKQGRYIKQRNIPSELIDQGVIELKKFKQYEWGRRGLPYWFIYIEQPTYQMKFVDGSICRSDTIDLSKRLPLLKYSL